MNESLLSKLKRIKLSDIGHFFLFLFALLPAMIYRRRRPHLWLLCEYDMEAQDNGYALFKYLRKSQPQVDAVYAISDRSPVRDVVSAVGPTVPYGSFRHWVYYLAAEVNISSQKGGKPNAALCAFFELNNVFGAIALSFFIFEEGILLNELFDLVIFIDFTKYFG